MFTILGHHVDNLQTCILQEPCRTGRQCKCMPNVYTNMRTVVLDDLLEWLHGDACDAGRYFVSNAW